MNDAAVGFQCSDCVRQGAKETRSGRAAYGGQRSTNPALTAGTLIGINVFVWLLITVTGGKSSVWIDRLALTPQGRCTLTEDPSLYYPQATEATCRGAGVTWQSGVADGAWWQLITSAFTHVEIFHILFNLLAVWFLAPQLEAALGRVRLLAVYLGSALTGSAAVMLLGGASGTTLGASGAVFGLLAALVVLVRKVGADARPLLGWLAINVVITFMVPNISWQGHLGGFIGGALLTLGIVYAPRERRGLWQALAVAGVVLISLALIGVRVAALS
ncbi:rhomboid family intramembrane serine protease [Nocardioides sp. Bht2]|uniref:rhomboid family intramembrane serine protease n=1 Tax=Nocardioides sp. Bht2 TaxID=3392297 RepID=UPI0039B3A34D